MVFASHSLGHFRNLQITLVRTLMLYSSCHRLSSEYDTRSGVKSDVRKWAVSLTVYTLLSKHGNDRLTYIAADIHWRTENAVRPDSWIGIATRYGLEFRGIKSQFGTTFSAQVQTGPGAYSGFKCNMDWAFTREQSAALTTHVNLGQNLRKKRAISLLHLWALWPFLG